MFNQLKILLGWKSDVIQMKPLLENEKQNDDFAQSFKMYSMFINNNQSASQNNALVLEAVSAYLAKSQEEFKKINMICQNAITHHDAKITLADDSFSCSVTNSILSCFSTLKNYLNQVVQGGNELNLSRFYWELKKKLADSLQALQENLNSIAIQLATVTEEDARAGYIPACSVSIETLDTLIPQIEILQKDVNQLKSVKDIELNADVYQKVTEESLEKILSTLTVFLRQMSQFYLTNDYPKEEVSEERQQFRVR
ncbi:MAG: hypothetical protein H0W64_03960 [Gammaproteobacteria bacterium]|nr:hypothetical protein [Gammaproteobacteria bacterium]